jgi:hypothetical protein
MEGKCAGTVGSAWTDEGRVTDVGNTVAMAVTPRVKLEDIASFQCNVLHTSGVGTLCTMTLILESSHN